MMKILTIAIISVFVVACANPTGTYEGDENLSFDQLIHQGRSYFDQTRYQRSVEIFERAIQIDDSRVEGFYGAGVALSVLCVEEGQGCRKSSEYLDKAIEIDDTYRDAYYNRALNRIVAGDFEGAIADLDIAIERNSADGEYYAARAFAKIELDRVSEACRDFEALSRINPVAARDFLRDYCR